MYHDLRLQIIDISTALIIYSLLVQCCKSHFCDHQMILAVELRLALRLKNYKICVVHKNGVYALVDWAYIVQLEIYIVLLRQQGIIPHFSTENYEIQFSQLIPQCHKIKYVPELREPKTKKPKSQIRTIRNLKVLKNKNVHSKLCSIIYGCNSSI